MNKPLLGLLLALLFAQVSNGLDRRDLVVVDEVDIVERNFFYDDQGKLVFVQWIFWEWCPVATRHQVRDWRLDKGYTCVRVGDGWALAWRDENVLRKVRAGEFRETWTQHDPELFERSNLPKEWRRGLTTSIPAPRRTRFR